MNRTRFAVLSLLAVLQVACGSPESGSWAGRSTNDPLVGGVATYERPEVGSVWVDGHMCTGTLVGPNLVVTASHCVGFRSHDEAGEWGYFAIALSASDTRWYRVQRVAAFSTEWSDEKTSDDVALLDLLEPVPQWVATPALIARSEPAEGTKATIYGYGCQQRGAAALRAKQKVSVSWGETTEALCPGDSGGPTMTDDGIVARVNSGYYGTTGDDFFGLVYRHAGDIDSTATRWGRSLGRTAAPLPPTSRTQVFRAHLPTTTLNAQIWVRDEAGRWSYVSSPADYGRYGIAADESNVVDIPWPNRAFLPATYSREPGQVFWFGADTASGIEVSYPQVPASATEALRGAYIEGKIVPASPTGWAVLLQQGIYVP